MMRRITLALAMLVCGTVASATDTRRSIIA